MKRDHSDQERQNDDGFVIENWLLQGFPKFKLHSMRPFVETVETGSMSPEFPSRAYFHPFYESLTPTFCVRGYFSG